MKQILKMLIISFVLQVFNVFASFSVAATFPQDLEYSLYSDVLIDAGYIWQINSTFHPFTSQLPDSNKSNCSSLDAFSWMNRYLNDYSCKSAKVHKKTVDGLSIIMIPGLGLAKQTGEASIYDQMAMQPFFWTEASLQNNWYARLYLRFTNEVNSLPHYTGIRRDIARIGLNTGESDQALLGYKNKWAQIEYGRSREIWGFLASENLLLSGNSPPYEKLTLQLNYRHFTYRWFYGFLESRVSSDGLNINRYLAGRVLEYRNKHNFVMSVGEISVLAGPNRPLDWAFLNPLALHIEIEQNERENDVVANHSNGILFINTDWMVNPSLRLAGSLIIDDFQLDQKDRDEGDPDPVGCMAHIAWTPIKRHLGVTFFCNYIRIGTYTLPHSYRYTNLVSRGEMIGHPCHL